MLLNNIHLNFKLYTIVVADYLYLINRSNCIPFSYVIKVYYRVIAANLVNYYFGVDLGTFSHVRVC